MNKTNFVKISTLLNEKDVKTVSPSFKLANKDIFECGIIPVISQDKDFIVGYSDLKDEKLNNPPYILFGDHTECFKWVDCPFVQGADGLKIFKCNESRILNKYFYYSLLSCYNKTGFYERHYKMLKRTYIPFFSIGIQTALVKVLSKYDDLIKNNESRIEKLEKILELIYKEWFVHFRFPNYKKTIITNRVPEGWKYYKFSDLFKIIRGVSYSSEEIECQNGINLINLKNIKSYGGFRRDGTKLYDGKYKIEQTVKYKDLIMGVTDMTQDRRTVGHVALVPNMDGVITADLVKFESKLDNVFSYCMFKYGFYSKLFSQFGNGANVIHLKPSSIKNQKLLIPTESLIDSFVNYVNPIIDEIELLNEKNENLSKQRDYLLPRLISNKIDFEGKEII